MNSFITFNIKITFDRKGSVILSYEVITNLTGKHDSEVISMTKRIYAAATEWKKGILNGTVDMNRTRELNIKRSELLLKFQV